MSRDLRRPLRDAWIIDAVRTPIGRYGGALATVRPDDLAALDPSGRRSVRPAKPVAANWRSDSKTVMIATPSSAEIPSIELPSAERSTIQS